MTIDKRRVCESDGTVREAIILSGDVNEDTLEHDIDKGADPYKPLMKATSEDLQSQVVVIRTDNMEQALFAITYLNAKQNVFDGIDYTDYTDPKEIDLDTYNPAEDGTIYNIVPICNAGEIVYKPGPIGFGFGDLSMGGLARNPSKTPYWEAHEGSIIVINSASGFNGPELLEDAIGRLITNKSHIYVIHEETHSSINDDGGDNDEQSFETMLNGEYLNAVVKYNASVLFLKEGNHTKYYEKILKGLCAKHDISIPQDYPTKEFIALLRKTMPNSSIDFMNQLLLWEKSKRKTKVLDMNLFKLLGKIGSGDSSRSKGYEILDSLEGMAETKEELLSLTNSIKFNKARQLKGMKTDSIVAIMFAGPPGTAKTTAARAVADILAEEKLLPGNRFVSVSGSGLQAAYVGQTTIKVRSLVEENDVIFVDECYSLSQSMDNKSPYADEAMAELCVQMTEAAEKNNKLFIFAGYGGADSTEDNNLMKEFLNSNPGIKSRVSTIIDFPSYNGKEMANIFIKMCSNNGYEFDDSETKELKTEIEAYFNKRTSDPSFGNGREARNLLSEAVRIHANITRGKSIDDITDEELKNLTVDDVHKAIASLEKMERIKSGNGSKGIRLVGFRVS